MSLHDRCEGCDGRRSLKADGFEYMTAADMSRSFHIRYGVFQRHVYNYRLKGYCYCEAVELAITKLKKRQKDEGKIKGQG